ncbi:MAG: hypothetical protein AAF372_04960 [Pseudomonadota bacterium]
MKTELSEKDLELISKSLDEDLSEFERRRLNQNVLTTEEGEKTWMRYYAVSAVMNKQFPENIDKDFSQKILDVINNDEYIEDDTNHPTIKRVGLHLKQVAGLAVAASVAAVSIVTFQNFNQPSLTGSPEIIVSEQKTEAPNIPVQVNTPPAVKPRMSPIEVPQVEFAPAQLSSQDVLGEQPFAQEDSYSQELDPYIQNHAGYGSERTISPYVDIIELKDVQK